MVGNIIFIHYRLLLLKKIGFIAEYYLFKIQFLRLSLSVKRLFQSDKA